ncbi:MAG: hypothetical protein KatS3mg057_1176 [Herpetosiphonaceae bacterium]|nr:MAG: hypothetical protein KatS3mg057_1176 [Herpetosiphonaceae bacterium]
MLDRRLNERSDRTFTNPAKDQARQCSTGLAGGNKAVDITGQARRLSRALISTAYQLFQTAQASAGNTKPCRDKKGVQATSKATTKIFHHFKVR